MCVPLSGNRQSRQNSLKSLNVILDFSLKTLSAYEREECESQNKIWFYTIHDILDLFQLNIWTLFYESMWVDCSLSVEWNEYNVTKRNRWSFKRFSIRLYGENNIFYLEKHTQNKTYLIRIWQNIDKNIHAINKDSHSMLTCWNGTAPQNDATIWHLNV